MSALLAMLLALATPVGPVPVPAYRQAADVVIISIHDQVDSVTASSLRRRLAEASDADAIVIELNTPGGDLMSTLDICYQIKTAAPANTVAWIRPHAFSAGTIIALACRQIIVAPASTFGDAAPITPMGSLPAAERAKIESPVLAEVVDSARRNHYDERLVEAFVSVGIELWLLEQVSTGRLACVNAGEYEAIFGQPPPRDFTPVSHGPPVEGVLAPFFQSMGEFQDSGLGDLEPAFVQQLPPSRPTLGAADADDWRLVRQVVPTDRLLTLTAPDAIAYGVASDVIADEQALQAWFGATQVRRLDRSWSETLARFLVSWPVRLVLTTIFLACLLVEFATGGTGLFGAGAVVALAMLLGGPWVAGLAQAWDIILVVGGLGLVAVELFLIPGMGVAGIAGVACLFAGMIGTFMTGDLGSPHGQAQAMTGVVTTLGGAALAAVLGWLVLRQLSSSTVLQYLVLSGEIHGHVAEAGLAGHAPVPDIGAPAVAITDLRPSGRIEWEGNVLDATTSGEWIESGANVVVTTSGMTIEVEEVQA